MSQTFLPYPAHGHLYTRVDGRFSSFHASAQRATRQLERHRVDARERSELARWEAEGGAVMTRNPVFQERPAYLSMHPGMSRRPSY
jgi:hypothetical protein